MIVEISEDHYSKVVVLWAFVNAKQNKLILIYFIVIFMLLFPDWWA